MGSNPAAPTISLNPCAIPCRASGDPLPLRPIGPGHNGAIAIQTPQPSDVARLLQQALDFHRRGDLQQAADLYGAALRRQPKQFDALHLLGLLRLQQGKAAEALPLIEAANKARPNSPDVLANLGAALAQLNRPAEALAAYDKVIATKRDDVSALYNRGVILTTLGRLADAIESYDKVIAAKPDHINALVNRATLLAHLFRNNDALAAYDRVLAVAPNHADAHVNRGNVLARCGRGEEALAGFERALAIEPGNLLALNNRANILRELKRHAEATASFEQALAGYDRALAARPGDATLHYGRGVVLQRLGRNEDAIASFDIAIAINPDSPDAFANRGNALFDMRRPEAAIESYRRALALFPDDRPVISSTSPAFVHMSLIFTLNFQLGLTTADHQAERARWAERHAHRYKAAILPHFNVPNPDRRLRIGYVSGHFRRQAATYAFGGVLLNHDRDRFEVFCYSDTIEEDDVTALLRARADKWHQTAGLSDDDLASLIRADGIDILVDTVGHMTGHRLLVFARKPAPVQATGWGEPTGTGLETMDYQLADPVLVPETERPLFRERIADLPNFIGFWSPDPLPEPGALPALANGYVTFGSLNRLVKLTDPVLQLWAELLRAIPTARLIVKDRMLGDQRQQARVHEAFAARGIAADRLTLIASSGQGDYRDTYRQIDIALDPFPHGGAMTTMESLWMGVPVLTSPGATISSRLAASCLTAMGLEDFIVRDPAQFISVAAAKAANLDALSTLRESLRRRIVQSEVGDPVRYARAVETAYRKMWREWCENQGAKSAATSPH